MVVYKGCVADDTAGKSRCCRIELLRLRMHRTLEKHAVLAVWPEIFARVLGCGALR
jgi:hypothetical protein